MNMPENPAAMLSQSIGRSIDPAPAVLRVAGLQKVFGGNVVLDRLDLVLHKGEVVLLRGENGSGKTTLLNILTGNIEPDAGRIDYRSGEIARSYCFPRRWWQELNPFDDFVPEFVARAGIARTWQDIRLFNSLSLRDNIAVAYRTRFGENPFSALDVFGGTRRRQADLRNAARADLAKVGLAEREESSADRVSLGQSKRVAIARAVAAGASILFLDEPLAGLDRQGIRDVLALLEDLVRRRGITLVIVEHVFNQIHLQGLATTDWLLQGGKLLMSSVDTPVGGPIDGQAPRHSCQTETRNSASMGEADWLTLLAGPDAEIESEPLPMGAVFTRMRKRGNPRAPLKPVLEVRNLVVRRGRRDVIGSDAGGFDLTLHEGEIGIIQAPNGWGKTTLLTTMAGLVAPARGDITLDGSSLRALRTWQRIARGLRLVPSQSTLFPSLSEAATHRLAQSNSPNQRRSGKVGQLSGGQKQFLALTAIKPGGRAILLDEPFAGLDAAATRRAIADHLLTSSGCILIAVPLTAQRKSQDLPESQRNPRSR